MRFDEIARQDASEVRTADALCDLADETFSQSLSGRARAASGGSSIYRRSGKRALDLILVVFFAPAWVTLIALLALLVRRDGGPAFYTQDRIGMGGRVFKMWKLRSMVVGADELLAAHLAADPAAHAEWAEKQKLRRDPRITQFGQFIRKTSLDELPQLWNVLLGDMSLVGPRPMMVGQEALYDGSAYYRLKPGVTGPWQVSPRNQIGFADRAIFDDAYEREVGFVKDIGLILSTVRIVVRATGH